MDYDRANGLADRLKMSVDEVMFCVRRDSPEKEVRMKWKKFTVIAFELYQELGLVKPKLSGVTAGGITA